MKATFFAVVLCFVSIAHAGPLADQYQQRTQSNDQKSYQQVIAGFRMGMEKLAGSKSTAQEIDHGNDGDYLYLRMANGKICVTHFQMVNETQASSDAPDCE